MSRARENALSEAIQDVPPAGTSPPVVSVTVTTESRQPESPKGAGSVVKQESKGIALQENKSNTDEQGTPLIGRRRRSPDNEAGNERV